MYEIMLCAKGTNYAGVVTVTKDTTVTHLFFQWTDEDSAPRVQYVQAPPNLAKGDFALVAKARMETDKPVFSILAGMYQALLDIQFKMAATVPQARGRFVRYLDSLSRDVEWFNSVAAMLAGHNSTPSWVW
ncbi:MAG: hypothetical protein ACYDCW_01745 [Acidithiobacillus ferrivorans]